MELSNRVQTIKPSPTLAVTARAAQLKAEGKDIIGLGAGEPDFDTPQHIKDAAIAAINKGLTKYTPVGGTPGLKNAIVAKFKRENNFDFEAKQILVSCGGKQSFFNLALSVINPGDEVIIPAPYWVSYPDIVLIAEGKPVFINTGIEQNFKISAEQLEAAITPKTRMFVINSPSNPSGAVYTIDELKALGEILRKYPQILIATDDMYEHILLSNQVFTNIANACPDLFQQTVVLNGVSKAYSMTGWRIGYCGGPSHIITAMENIQSQSTSNPSSISQAAAEAALNGDQSCIHPMVFAFRERNAFVTEQLNQINGIRCLPSDGAFYAFADVRQSINDLYERKLINGQSDIAFSEYLLEGAGVAVVPGSAFGCEGYMRLSFATSLENLQQALNRIKNLLK
ncbi:pyridoxal phosphate-dependent aminotransferase [Nitrosomonas sp. Nm166]|uniref:pyridoxal phosphate-dependent aminotransferase n=1 Tax=Nitrosomonas sp. Nm166 TaxID=1881054 RepID=UPI0008E0B488|nr:pyridoxal phosphate-dependent aminotransferase [Nitrosomonas sp. Nm166]SFE08044.1 aspartate aminotransferase [Nitrosomonas sp. Nm166]